MTKVSTSHFQHRIEEHFAGVDLDVGVQTR